MSSFEQQRIQSMNSYIAFLEERNMVKQSGIIRRKNFLHFLLYFLKDIDILDGAKYRIAVNKSLLKFTEKEQPFYLEVSREFFPFLTEDKKTAVEQFDKFSYGQSPIETCRFEDLDDWYANSQELEESAQEFLILDAYKKGLEKVCTSPIHVQSHYKIARAFAVSFLRDVEAITGLDYRARVDEALTLYKDQKAKQFFLQVIREYYRFWMLDPDAEKMFERCFLEK